MNPYGTGPQAAEHFQQALSLTAAPYAELFSIHMRPIGQAEIKVFLSAVQTVTWRGYTWEGFQIALTDFKKDATGEVSRPRLTIANPQSIFSRYAHRRYLDGAEIRRYRVLKPHLDANVNSFIVNYWNASRVAQINGSIITLELRSSSDGQDFTVPGRAYMPPDFPSVSV